MKKIGQIDEQQCYIFILRKLDNKEKINDKKNCIRIKESKGL